jgi:hypothetical protein
MSQTRAAAFREETMMRLVTALLASMCCLAFGACTVTGPQVKLKPPIEIKMESEKGHGGKFCPPGHAKKGNC